MADDGAMLFTSQLIINQKKWSIRETGGLIRVWLWRASPELNGRRGRDDQTITHLIRTSSQTGNTPGRRLRLNKISTFTLRGSKKTSRHWKTASFFAPWRKLFLLLIESRRPLNLFILLLDVDGSRSLKSPNIWPVCLMNSGYDAVQTWSGTFIAVWLRWQRILYQCITYWDLLSKQLGNTPPPPLY